MKSRINGKLVIAAMLFAALLIAPFGAYRANRHKSNEAVAGSPIKPRYASFEEAKRADPSHNFASLAEAKAFAKKYAGTSMLQCPSGSVSGGTYIGNECISGCSGYCQVWYYDAGNGYYYTVNTCGCVEGP